MDIQALYNKLRVKRAYGRGDVVLRLSYEEMELIFDAMLELGAEERKGTDYVTLIQEMNRQIVDDALDEKSLHQAYDGLRAKVNTGKWKDAVGIIHVTKDEKKPFRIDFPSGEKQVYTEEQFTVISKDRTKYEQTLNAIIFTKGTEA